MILFANTSFVKAVTIFHEVKMSVSDLVLLLRFWAIVTALFGIMLFMAWRFRIGDPRMIRRTAIYFVAMFVILPAITLGLFTVSESLAKAIFAPALLLGTLVYLAFTVIAIIRPRP